MSDAAALTVSLIPLARFILEEVERGKTEMTREELDAAWERLRARRAQTKVLKDEAKKAGGYT